MHPQTSRRRAISTTIDRGYPPVLTPRQASGPLQGTVVVPGSKSITNRALLVAALAEGESVLAGALESDDTLYMAGALNALGADAQSEMGTGCPPIVVNASGLPGGTAEMAGDLSSQYFSALLMAAPYAQDGVEVGVIGDLVSKPYLPMTVAVMSAFGVQADLDTVNWARLGVQPGQRYTGRHFQIEPDASNASYFFAAAAVTGGRVRVEGLGRGSTQGDLAFVEVLRAMGADVSIEDDATEVQGPPNGDLRGVDLDLGPISDTAQTLAAIAPFANGPTTIRGVAHARLKETDRVAALAVELRKLGQDVEEFQDGLRIAPRPITPAAIRTYDDHRMAMSFAIAALRAPGIQVLDPGCVAKTFPHFFDVLDAATP